MQFLSHPKKTFVITSGSISISTLKPYFPEYGLFYPLQTLTIDTDIAFENIPVLIDGNTKETCRFLFELGNKISKTVSRINEHERVKLHLAAVIVNNFVNYLFRMAGDVLSDNPEHKSFLIPLIDETIRKNKIAGFASPQTGPAVRGDLEVISKHLEQLKNIPDYIDVYKVLSKSINSKINI
jgi:hypothetical protein